MDARNVNKTRLGSCGITRTSKANDENVTIKTFKTRKAKDAIKRIRMDFKIRKRKE